MLIGLDFERKGTGSIVLDRRNGHPQFVGLIVKRPLGTGYMLCPFVLWGIEFSEKVPDYFRSVDRGERWVRNHAMLWNPKRRYTFMNGLIWHLLPANSIERRLKVLHFQGAIYLFILSVIIAFFIPANTLSVSVTLKGIGISLFIMSIFNLFLIFRERL